jgi:hypothetical protein
MESETTVARADLWRKRVVAQQASGQKIRAWCKAHDVQEHAFHWWRARLGLSPVREKQRQSPVIETVGFARVVVNPPAMQFGESIRLSLLGGRELSLPMSMPVEQIARLVRAIEVEGTERVEGMR